MAQRIPLPLPDNPVLLQVIPDKGPLNGCVCVCTYDSKKLLAIRDVNQIICEMLVQIQL